MKITVGLPQGVAYSGTLVWFFDAEDDWTVADLNEDVSYYCHKGGAGLRAVSDGVPVDTTLKCLDEFTEGQTVSFEKVP